MANKKFSEFTLKTDSANVDFVVGYDGTDNVRIAPSNLSSGGASDLNGLSDVLIDGTSNYFVNIPAGLSGNPADNLIIGSNAGTDLTSGTKNVIIGKDAGENLLAGTENTMLGVDAGTALTNGSRNTFLGSSAGFFTGNSIVDVVAIGYKAGTYAAAGTAIAIGREAGRNNSGNGRIDVGYRAGYSNSSGGWNLNIGYFAAYSNTTGSENTVIGTEAGINNTGSSNTFLGYQAGYNQTTGSNNTVIGHDAEPSAVDATNEITLGDANIATLRCQVQTISALSDSRDKTNVQPSTYGLDFINKLNPVTFDWNMRDGAKVGDKDLGFIAQELQEVDDESLQLVYANNPDRLEASYGRLIPVLVKAIQELKLELDNCKNCK